MMSQTYSTSDSGTYTEARAAAIMLSVLEDIIVHANAHMISHEKAKKWMEDLLFFAKAKALRYFELQYYTPDNVKAGTGYRYVLSDDGSLHENSMSGGINPFDVPIGYSVGLFADIDHSKRGVTEYASSRGWGTNGVPLNGQGAYERAYSKDGYGLNRYKI